MRPEFADGTWRLGWNPYLALAIGIVWALVLLSGWASLRYLRAGPDLPRKQELLWGAEWIGRIGFGWFVLISVISAVGIGRTAYPFTFVRLSYLAFVGLIPLLLLLPRQAAGWVACWHGLAAQLRGRPPDWKTWAAEEETAAQTSQGRWLLAGVFGIVLLVWLYITFAHFVQVDVAAIRMQREQALAEALKLRLAEMPVEELAVALYCRPHRVVVRLRDGTSEASVQEATKRVQDALAQLEAEGEWTVEVHAPRSSDTERPHPGEDPSERGASDAG
jgi:hypothetical protein